jgi:hypothetical protein
VGVAVEGEAQPSFDDFFLRLRAGLRSLLRRPSAADALARELALLAYAFFFWCLPPPPVAQARAFTLHRSGNYGAVLGVLLALSLGELYLVHLVLSPRSPVAANIILAISAYSIAWLFGDYQALRLRRVLVTEDTLHIRVGLRTEVSVPLGDIQAIERVPATGAPSRGAAGYLRCAVIGPPELLLRLRRPIEAERMFRRSKTVTCIGLTVDDESALQEALQTTSARAVAMDDGVSGLPPA